MSGPPVVHVLHAAQLRDLADGPTFSRGERYFREGRVSALARDGKTIRGTVKGATAYDVRLWGAGGRIAYACSCPVGEEGGFCKHCVAVALQLIEARNAQPDDEEEGDEEQDEVDEPEVPPTKPLSKARGARPPSSTKPVKPEPRPEIATPAARSSAPPASGGAVEHVAPAPLPEHDGPQVFLAGSIDQGEAEDWQREAVAALADIPDLAILNPRRREWDGRVEGRVEDPDFVAQVEWELEAMERADVIAMYFAPASRAPITLLELGLHAASGKLIVCCPDGYFRKGNVDLVCRRYGVHQTHDFAALLRALRARLGAARSKR
ncbi:MAG: nucleoside 2-deoxyribosyltransferase domain-containing protein [Polyangiaceae bacterium]